MKQTTLFRHCEQCFGKKKSWVTQHLTTHHHNWVAGLAIPTFPSWVVCLLKFGQCEKHALNVSNDFEASISACFCKLTSRQPKKCAVWLKSCPEIMRTIRWPGGWFSKALPGLIAQFMIVWSFTVVMLETEYYGFHDQYYACWCPGSIICQGNSSHVVTI